MRTLASFKDIHKGETIIVCGCGSSLNELKNPERFITIGVNDVGRLFHPNYLVVLNPRSQFKENRFHYVETSEAEYLFTQLDLGHVQPQVVRFRLGQRGGTDFSDPNVLHYAQNSPYVALCLAVHMGAKRIGLIGVDFTDHHFFKKTGRHVLSPKLARIDTEYKNLQQALSKQGIEVINLSQQSRLTAFEKGTIDSLEKMTTYKTFKNESANSIKKYKLFFVNYKFLSCGDVFRHGLKYAAQDLGIEYAEDYWDDNHLPDKIRQLEPDLVFVVHGRKFALRWKDTFKNYNTAVWLLDEPYEVDDTSKFSGYFDTVFVNDPCTIDSHKNALYLPVCYDPVVYCDVPGPKEHDVGFIGGHNPVRQQMLEMLVDEGLLSYVVGGPWKGTKLDRLCLSGNIPHDETAAFYKKTKIILNIFRSRHHFNARHIPPTSLNPRIYEAIACGAVVVSENRPEIKQVFPQLPVFENKEQMVYIVRKLLQDEKKREKIKEACIQQLKGNTYSHRLENIIDNALDKKNSRQVKEKTNPFGGQMSDNKHQTMQYQEGVVEKIWENWEDYGGIVQPTKNGTLVFEKRHDNSPGSERGLVSKKSYEKLDLSFEVNIKEDSCFIAKIHQKEKLNQLSNSYHLFCLDHDYFARHNHVFKHVQMNRNCWEKIKMVFDRGTLTFFKNQRLLFRFNDRLLKKGYAFLGTKGGHISLRNIRVHDSGQAEPKQSNRDVQFKRDAKGSNGKEYNILWDSFEQNTPSPLVSIITTVYDRVECLRNCIKSVKNLSFKDYEHIIVADFPSPKVLEQLKAVVRQEDNGKLRFINLTERYNNWGIKPASIGVQLSYGRYICFLSDDNGYTSDHMEPLVEALERSPGLGFVYSSCRYAGRKVLNSPVPRPARIDLGQPMFRRELFSKYLNNNLPFDMLAWDWHMIDTFMKKGVRWKHINKPTFLFRLHQYPHLMSR